MRRSKLILAMVAAVVMITVGPAPAIAQNFADDCGDFSVADRCTFDVGRPRNINGLVCFKVKERDASGDTIDRFWDCIDPQTGEEFIP